MSLKRRYENCLVFVDDWEKQSEGMTMRKMRSWNTLVHVDSSKAVWSRMPSMPVFEVADDEDRGSRVSGARRRVDYLRHRSSSK